MTRLRADFLLFITAFIWGTAFIAQKYAIDTLGPFSFTGARFLLSALALIPLALYEAKKATAPLSKKDLMIAGAIGLCLFFGSTLQQVALQTTTATNAGFLTALYVVFVPFVMWLMTKKRPRFVVVFACVVSITGAWLLTANGETHQWTKGDGLLIISDIAWALGISLVPLFLERVSRPFFLCVAQYGITAILGLSVAFFFEPVTFHGFVASAPTIVYTGLLSGGIAYTLQIIAQKATPAAEAALIMSLESVFAAIAAAIILHERLTVMAMIGCSLILLGVIIAEVGPIFLRGLKPPRLGRAAEELR